MRRIELTGIREMTVFEREVPELKEPGDVLLKILSVGVCGSDIHYYTTGRIGSQVVAYPYAVGHECSAQVEAVGENVEGLQPGDVVAVDPAVSCGTCDQCRAGRSHTCRNLVFMGCPGQVPGCLSDYYVMPARSCYRVPQGMEPDVAALVEPLSIGIYALKLSGVREGERIAILGLGPIGLSVLAAARQLGIRDILVTEKRPYRLSAAKRMASVQGYLVDHNGNGIAPEAFGQYDAVFECCGQQDALDRGCDLLRPGGKLMVVGIPQVDRISFSPDILRRHELCVQHVRRQNECVNPAIELVQQASDIAEIMITHRFDFSQTREAFDLVADYRDGVIKAMIHVNQR